MRWKCKLKNEVYNECLKDEVNYTLVEELIQKGADSFDEEDNYYGHTLFDAMIIERELDDDNDMTLVEILKIFLKYGRLKKYDTLLDYIEYFKPAKANKIMELFIDDDLTYYKLLYDYIDYLSCLLIGCDRRRISIYSIELLYMASYPNIPKKYKDLCYLIDVNKNRKYDATKFRDMSLFKVILDTKNMWSLDNNGIIVNIYEKETNNLVWKFIL